LRSSNQPSCIHARIPRNFGMPGVALLDNIRSPGNTSTLLCLASGFMCSRVELIVVAPFVAVASDILTHGTPTVDIQSFIGLGDAPRVMSHKDENLTVFQQEMESSGIEYLFVDTI